MQEQSRNRCFDGKEKLNKFYYPQLSGDRVFQTFDIAGTGYNSRTFHGDQYAKINSGYMSRIFGEDCMFNELASDPRGYEYARSFEVDSDGALILAADEEDRREWENPEFEPVDMLARLADEVSTFGTNPADFQTLENIGRLAYANSNELDRYTRCNAPQQMQSVAGQWA